MIAKPGGRCAHARMGSLPAGAGLVGGTGQQDEECAQAGGRPALAWPEVPPQNTCR